MNTEMPYDFALSFAGEDRALVEEVADFLRFFDCKVFYDDWQRSEMLGKDLYQYLAEIYETKAKYCVLFISKDYQEKRWPKHERKFAFARDFRNQDAYILPVRIDDTQVVGLPETIGFLDAREFSASQIAILLTNKVGASIYDGDSTDLLLDKVTHWTICRNGDVSCSQRLSFLYLGREPKNEHTFRVWSPANNSLKFEDLRARLNGQELRTNLLSQTRLSREFAVEFDRVLSFGETIEYDVSYRCLKYYENTNETCQDEFRASIPIWRWQYYFSFESDSEVDDFEAFREIDGECIRIPCRHGQKSGKSEYSVSLQKPKIGTLLKVRFRLA